ncbi:MAG: alpha/beta hydrolase [Burkholderiaceae bacterium]|jgi:alpha/beta superfamily hydrolase|nr:alpha/beta hydrolase [Burkholderiaceae bacterium]
MNSSVFTVHGPAGDLQAVLELPASAAQPLGTVVIAHPHPLFGGTMDNKVVRTLARAWLQCGWRAVRFNFRGVGASAGAHDEGRGEADDLLAVAGQAVAPGQALALAGFSFGACMAAQAIARLHPQRPIAAAVLVGLAAARFAAPPIPQDLQARTLIVHGERDDTAPLAAVMDWARPQLLPVTVVPGGGHFFHGQLPLLKALAERHVRGCA